MMVAVVLLLWPSAPLSSSSLLRCREGPTQHTHTSGTDLRNKSPRLLQRTSNDVRRTINVFDWSLISCDISEYIEMTSCCYGHICFTIINTVTYLSVKHTHLFLHLSTQLHMKMITNINHQMVFLDYEIWIICVIDGFLQISSSSRAVEVKLRCDSTKYTDTYSDRTRTHFRCAGDHLQRFDTWAERWCSAAIHPDNSRERAQKTHRINTDDQDMNQSFIDQSHTPDSCFHTTLVSSSPRQHTAEFTFKQTSK